MEYLLWLIPSSLSIAFIIVLFKNYECEEI